MNLTIAIPLDTATPRLARLAGLRERAAELHAALGGAALQLAKNQLAEYSATHPNALGGSGTNYWAEAGADAWLAADATAATLNFPTPGLGRAFHDVTITAGATKLTLPATAAAFNHRADSFTGLTVFWGRGRALGLRQGEQQTRTRTTQAGEKGSSYWAPQPGGLVYYWFADCVFQPQNRDLLPSDEQLSEAGRAALIDYIEKLQAGVAQ